RVEPVDGAVGDEDVFGIDLRYPVSVAELGGHQLTQARNAVGLQVMRLVPGDRAYDRRLHRLRRIEADVALIETERIRDGIHHVANADDAGERYLVEVQTHWIQISR